MFQLNGKKISIDDELTIGEGDAAITYPAGSLKNAELRTDLGIVEVPDQVRPDERFYFVAENDDGTLNITPKDLAPIKSQYYDMIDQAVDAKRSAAVSKGAYLTEEYRMSYDDAVSFRAAGYAGAVPRSVKSWSVAGRMTPKAAAENIIATRDGYMTLLATTRDIRLMGKAAIDAAATPEEILAALSAVNSDLSAILN